MNALIRFYLKIFICKEKPQNSPYSPFLLFISTFITFILSYLVIYCIDLYAPVLFFALVVTPIGRIANETLFLLPFITIIYTIIICITFHIKRKMVQMLTCLLMSINITYIILFALFFFLQFLITFTLNFTSTSIGLISMSVFIQYLGISHVINIIYKIYNEALGSRLNAICVVVGWVCLAFLIPLSLH
ncbi:hypothetical protein [Legionella sp. PC997]|uniref:hypothetical protein n=1 Tax=Legionella sp. PC997 TaxID=2755562 RepID=UPI0015FC058E|nr:hypothetical protein [Legionella sp. PC997]QMT60181.1 hypothetical protein HBNCFIEN_01551 [Legionella sp. PC997]